MGCGKSTLLKHLKSDKELFLVDLDDEIKKELDSLFGEDELGNHIRKIGLAKFREIETNVLENIDLDPKKVNIIALGGGALEKNSDFILNHKSSCLVWINTPFETCYERIKDDLNRPLVSSKEELKKLYLSRLPLYERSNLILDETQSKSIKTYDELKSLLPN